MQKEDVRNVLIQTAKELLLESIAPEQITSRQIAARAGLNLAMINYCFKSKDELMTIAIGQIINESAGNPFYSKSGETPPLERLWNMLWDLCELVLKFQRFTKIYVPYILLKDGIEAPLYIIPILKEHFGEKKSETECRIIAYQLISFLQLIFYRSEAFHQYSGINLMNQAERKDFLKLEFHLFFNGGETNEPTD